MTVMRPHFLQIQIGVLEHEAPRMRVAASSRDWPPEIRRLVERELANWREHNPTRAIVGATYSYAIEGQAMVEFEHVDQSELPAVSARQEAAPAQHDMFAPAPASQCARCSE